MVWVIYLDDVGFSVFSEGREDIWYLGNLLGCFDIFFLILFIIKCSS